MSTNYEGLALVVCEAMAAKIPVIASNVPGMNEIIMDGENGFLIEPRNHLALADCIEKFLQDDFQHTQNEIVSKAEITVKQNFNLEGMLKKYEELVRRVL